MKIAFDFDGTITAYPQAFEALVPILKKGGAELVILTACAGEFPEHLRQTEAERRLASFGFEDIPVVWCHTAKKPAWCRKHNVDILVDDVPFHDAETFLQLVPNNRTNVKLP